MKVVQALNVDYIQKDKNHKVVNLFVIKLNGNHPDLVRKQKEFLTDLKNSGLLPLTFDVNHPNALSHPAFNSAFNDLKAMPFTIRGIIEFVKKGDMWTVTENSNVVKDVNHPDFGKYVVGQQKPYDNDATIVTDGFLSVTPNLEIIKLNKLAQAEVAMKAFSSGFDILETVEDEQTYGKGTTGNETGSPEIDPETLKQALGASEPETKPEPATAKAK